MRINNTCDLKNAIRQGPYAWPGGYPIYFITDDGEAISYDTVKSEYRLILKSVKDRTNDGWRVVAVDINWEDDDLYCCHSNEKIQPAYGKEA